MTLKMKSTGNYKYDLVGHPDANKVYELLKDEMKDQEYEDYEANKINWLEGDFYDSWDKVKGHWHKIIVPNSKERFDTSENPKVEKWFFLAHSNDVIKGKPQLIEQVQKKIPLIRLTSKINSEGKGEDKTEWKTPRYLFFDERYDKRYDGALIDSFALDFWIYRITTQEGKEYFIYTQKQLPNETCTLKGMIIELSDFAEMSRSLKIPSLSRIFFMKEFEPAVKILSKEAIVKYTSERKISAEDWKLFLNYHKFGTYNQFPEEVNLLRSAFVLSGKVDEYPMHISVLGPAGTRKTMGWIETLSFKFDEDMHICEGANFRIKGLIPSFKEKPADIGYLARAERIGFVDEMGKMVEFETNKHQSNTNNVLGELNMLLEHRKRVVGSGNANECEVQANAKFLIVSNPVSNKPTISAHVGLIDPTYMSRILWWVQSPEEQAFVLEKGVLRFPPTPSQAHPETKDNMNVIENRKKSIVLKKCWGKVDSRDEFLTLFDTCYSFVSDIDDSKINSLVNMTTQLAREPMKSSVWKPRAYHHIKLLIDGLCKHRCLFKDYDSSFIAREEDYTNAELILVKMVKSWDTDLSPKEDFR